MTKEDQIKNMNVNFEDISIDKSFSYEWNLKDYNFTKDKGKVFSTFSCGGGSTMGYKLAGFDVIGCNEIDPKLMKAYRLNHKPKYSFLESIADFKLRKDLPKELYDLDILDGSPPCSSFSMVGNREKDWGKNKKFTEGQESQVLDELFFDFIDLAKELQPKVVVAENVKGLLLGSAIEYVKRIYEEFDNAGYYCNHWLLNSQEMGVPQARERVFFICLRKDLAGPFLHNADLFRMLPKLELDFHEKEILFGDIREENGVGAVKISPCYVNMWHKKLEGETDMGKTSQRVEGVRKFFSVKYIYDNRVLYTILGDEKNVLFDELRTLSKREICLGGSYPLDYDFAGNKTGYLVGMSVPPVMMANIATKIYKQWLKKM